MLKTLLYGPESADYEGDTRVRSVVVNPELIGELCDVIERELGGETTATVWVAPPFDWNYGWGPADEREISSADVVKLVTPERARLSIKWHTPNDATQGSIILHEGSFPLIKTSKYALKQKLVRTLLANDPRPEWFRLLRFTPLLGALALIVSWLWVVTTTALSAPVVTFGSTFVALAVVLCIFLVKYLGNTPRFVYGVPGVRIRGESRKDTNSRRADANANVKVGLKVGLWTAPAGAVAGALATYLILGP